MEIQILEKIGLSPSEAKAYISCFELGPSAAAEIAKRANLNRSSCYDALDRLIEKGLLSSIKREKKTLFEATNPKRLFELLKEKETELSSFIKELEQTEGAAKRPKHMANVFEGYRGIKAVFEDILETLDKGDEYIVLGAIDVPQIFERYILHWTKRRASKKIKLKIIYNKEAISFIKQTKKLPLTEMKVIPKEYTTPATVNVYGNKTATILWIDKPVAFVVESKSYADSFRNYFKLLWQLAKK